MKVIKRDGREVPYDRLRIEKAVAAAMASSGGGSDADARKVAADVERHLEGDTKTVEEIQDLVERALMEDGFCEAAKAYCLYRDKRNRARDARSSLMLAIDEIVQADARESNRKRENANIDGNTPMGAMLHIGSACARAYNEAYFLRPEQAQAHREGWCHYHDFDFYAMTTTCCQIDLLKLFHGGFSTGHGYLREPQSIQSYAALAAIAIQANQNDQHGGQSIPNFDYSMAEGVRKTYRKWFIKLLDLYGAEDAAGLVSQAEEESGYSLAMEEDGAFDDFLAGLLGTEWRTRLEKVRAQALKETDRDTYQAMEGFVHNMNTMHSRAGAQV